MCKSVMKNILGSFFVVIQLFGLSREEPHLESAIEKIDLIAPKKSEREYWGENLMNGIEFVVIKNPSAGDEITLGVSIEWGCTGSRRPKSDFYALMSRRLTEIGPDAEKLRRFFWSGRNHVHMGIWAYKAQLDRELNYFFGQFSVGDKMNSEIAVDTVVEKVRRGEDLTDEEFIVLFVEVFLRSRITVMVFGNVTDEELRSIRTRASTIRSCSEKIVSFGNTESKEDLIKGIEEINAITFDPGCYMTRVISCENAFFKARLFQAAVTIINNRIKKSTTIKTSLSRQGAIGIGCSGTSYSKNNDLASFRFWIIARNVTCSMRNHEKILEILYLYLKKARISGEEFEEFIENLWRKFESEALGYRDQEIMEIISDASYHRLPMKRYLCHTHQFDQISLDDLNEALEKEISDIEKWTILISPKIPYSDKTADLSFRLSKEAIERIKSKINNEEQENPFIG